MKKHPESGSAFITVILFTFVLFMLVGSILTWSLTERRLNMRAAYWLEARNAAEALAEYGFSQIVTQFDRYATPPTFDPSGGTPLVLPPASFFAGSNVTTSTYSSSNPYGLELVGGTTASIPSSGGLFFVDPSNPNNQFDPLKGQYVYRRDVQVVTRATVVPAFGSPITAYVTEKVAVRGAPLFSHAIFYSNNDLEAAPGPVLDIYGPVHVNGNMFPMAQGTVETGTANSVNFHGPVSVSGDIYHSWGSEKVSAQGRGYNTSSSVLDGEPLGHDPVTFVNAAGTQVNMRNSSGTWNDSTMGGQASLLTSLGRYNDSTTPALTQLRTKLSTSFRQHAAQTWNGNLQTAAMGVQSYNPIGFTQPVDAAGTLPDPHTIVDPPATTAYLNPTGADAGYATARQQVEQQKFSMQTGLYVQVAVAAGNASTGTPDSATIKLFGPAGSAPVGTPSANVGPNGGILLGAIPSGLVSFVPYKATAVDVGSKITSGTNKDKYPVTTTTSIAGSSAAAVTYASSAPAETVVVNQGLYDQRQYAGINLIQLNVGALRTALETVNTGTVTAASIVDSTGALWGGGGSAGGGWNGALYVDVSAPSGNQTSVIMSNGQVSSGSSLLPDVNAVKGLTVVTNAPMYVLGHYNADGSNVDVSTTNNAAQYPDDGRTNAAGTPTSAEKPVALAADAITILSPNYFGTGSGTKTVPATNIASTNAQVSLGTVRPGASGDTEIAAAFITGIVATNASTFSGGVHNLPRFIENWGTNTVSIRGSLVSLYKSRYATQPWAQRYYSAPRRNWGFDKIFENGTYPPLTPRAMSYRRVDFSDLSSTAYNSARHALWPSQF